MVMLYSRAQGEETCLDHVPGVAAGIVVVGQGVPSCSARGTVVVRGMRHVGGRYAGAVPNTVVVVAARVTAVLRGRSRCRGRLPRSLAVAFRPAAPGAGAGNAPPRCPRRRCLARGAGWAGSCAGVSTTSGATPGTRRRPGPPGPLHRSARGVAPRPDHDLLAEAPQHQHDADDGNGQDHHLNAVGHRPEDVTAVDGSARPIPEAGRRAAAVASIRGRWMSTTSSSKPRRGMTTTTQAVTAHRTQRFSTTTRSSGARPGTTLAKMGPIRAKRSGTPVRSATM